MPSFSALLLVVWIVCMGGQVVGHAQKDCQTLDSIIRTATMHESSVGSQCCDAPGIVCDLGQIVSFSYKDWCGDCLVKLRGDVGTLFFQNLKHLRVLDLSHQALFGSWPEWINELGLEKLNLADNQLSGDLPMDWTDLTMLTQVDVSNNLFTGQLPRFSHSHLELVFHGNYIDQTHEDQDLYIDTVDRTTPTKRTVSEAYLAPRQTSPPVPPPTPSSGLSAGAIAGIVIGSLAGLALLGGLLYWCTRKNKKDTAYKGEVTSMGAAANVAQNPPTAYAQQYAQPVQPVQSVQMAAVPTTAVAGATGLSSSSSGSRRRTGYPEAAQPLSPADALSLEGKNAVAVRPYVPQLNDEMVLNKGDKVILKQVFDDGWALASNSLTKVEGLVPLACLMRTD